MSQLITGTVKKLSALVTRVTASNAGLMTGPGTNTWVVGDERAAVIDPGPADEQHIANILSSVKSIAWILVTHTHPDHSPGAKILSDKTGAPIIGATPPDDPYQDKTFKQTIDLFDGYELATNEFTLKAIYTPGHVNNHYCFFLQEENMVMTGDHIMQGSTVVIIPPAGDMQDYIHSLKKLANLQPKFLAPGHGLLIDDATTEINKLMTHRLKREALVIAALQSNPSSTLAQLTPIVYHDVDKCLWPMAELSLWAHLLKLEKEIKAYCGDGKWALF